MNEEQITEAVARVLFPHAIWETQQLAWIQCPGQDHHTGSNGKKDCRLTINDGIPPTLFCCHQSCQQEVAEWNYKLRSEIGKLKKSAGNIARKVGFNGKTTQISRSDATKIASTSLKPLEVLQPMQLPSAIADGQRRHLEACFLPEELVSIVLGKGIEGKPLDRGKTQAPYPLETAHEHGTYIRVNPMKPNGAGDNDVTAWRHCLIECDSAPLELQWAAINASGLPVSVAVYSGGRSIHAWARVDAATPEEFRERAKMAADAMEAFEGIVVDRKALNCSRLARLAGRQRFDAWQDLLAVNIGATCWDDWVAKNKDRDQRDEFGRNAELMKTLALEFADRVKEDEWLEDRAQFYYRKAKKDFIMIRDGVITPLTEAGIKVAMRQEGLVFDKEETEAEVYRVMTANGIDYDGSMPGYPVGLHVEGGRKYYCDAAATWFDGIAPDKLSPGRNWEMIHKLTTQLFVPRQSDEVEESQAWWHWVWALKMSREGLKTALKPLTDGDRRQVRPGQAMVLCGPKNCGKSFLVNQIIRPLLGGRQQDAHKAFASGAESFNGELLHGEVWTVDDKEHSHRIDQRRQFGASIKSMMYSGRVGFHAKHKEQITLQPFARLFILCNDQDDAIRVLPPLTADIEDKIHLFRCYYQPTPMPTATGAQWAAYEDRIHQELPFFAGWLDAIEIPERRKDQRNGSACWHDPYIVSLLSIQSPEYQLAQLLVHCLERRTIPQGEALTSMSILDAMREDEGIRATARNLIHDDPAVLGRYLGRIMADVERYQRQMGLYISQAGRHRGGNLYQLRLGIECEDARLVVA